MLGPAPADDYSDSDERSSGEDSDSSDDSDCSNDDSDSEGVPGSPGDNAVSLIQPPWLLQLPAHTCARLCCARQTLKIFSSLLMLTGIAWSS